MYIYILSSYHTKLDGTKVPKLSICCFSHHFECSIHNLLRNIADGKNPNAFYQVKSDHLILNFLISFVDMNGRYFVNICEQPFLVSQKI